MIILHLLAPARVGGLERVVQSLAIGQQARGHQVAVAAILDAEDKAYAFFEPLARAGIPVHRIIAPQRAYLRERRAVRSLLRRINPHVVHSHGYRADVVDSGVVRRLGVATVSTAHGYTGGHWRNRAYETLQRLSFRRFDAVIAVSEALGKLLRGAGVSSERLHVVPNAFVQIVTPLDRSAARASLGLPAEGFVVGWVGRMIREKGLDVLLDALPFLPDTDIVVCAIGAGPERQVQEQRAHLLGLGDRIYWAGLLPDAGRYFPAFDVYVISSRTEGLPISLFEAMASQVPIVTASVGGIPQAVTPDHAVLFEPERSTALALAIQSVHNDGAGAAKRALRARQRLQSTFDTATWISKHEEIYAAAIGLRSATRRRSIASTRE